MGKDPWEKAYDETIRAVDVHAATLDELKLLIDEEYRRLSVCEGEKREAKDRIED